MIGTPECDHCRMPCVWVVRKNETSTEMKQCAAHFAKLVVEDAVYSAEPYWYQQKRLRKLKKGTD